MWEELKGSPLNAATPDNIILGAGSIHKGLAIATEDLYRITYDTTFKTGKTYYTRSGTEGSYTYSEATVTTGTAVTADTYYEKIVAVGEFNFETSKIGATSGGSTVTITPELFDIDADGATVKVKGLTQKIGEVATIAVNALEFTKDFIKMTVVGQDGTSAFTGFDVIESKEVIEQGDYLDNFAYVGKKLNGDPFIIMFDSAICTTGLVLEGKNKENSVFSSTFECVADLTENTRKLPYHIYVYTGE